MAEGGEQLGVAYIKVRADVSGLDADFAAAEAKTNAKVEELSTGRKFKPGSGGVYNLVETGPYRLSDEAKDRERVTEAAKRQAVATDQVAQATAASASASNRYGQSLRDQVAGQRDVISGIRQHIGVMTSLFSSVAAVVGVMYTFYSIGRQISDLLFQNTERANALAAANRAAAESQVKLNEAQRASIERQYAAAGKSPEQAKMAIEQLEAAESRMAAESAAPTFKEADPRYIRHKNGGLRLFRAGVDPESEALDINGNPYAGPLPQNEEASARSARKEAVRRISSVASEEDARVVQVVKEVAAEAREGNRISRMQDITRRR